MKRDGEVLFENENEPLIVEPRRTSALLSMGNALHGAVEIKYFYEGASTLLIGGKTVKATAGDIVVINPYEFHTTVDCGTEKGKYHLMMVGLDFFSSCEELDLRRLLLGTQTVFRTLLTEEPYLRELILRVVEEDAKRQRGYRLVIRSLLTELFIHLLRHCTETVSPSADEDMLRYYSIIEPALRQMRDSYAQHFDVESLALLCNVSKYYFCRIFKRVMGESSMQYLNGYRLKIADALLKNTQKSVAEVARQCGFEDESYFCRCYKKYFHRSPGARSAKK